MVLSQKSPPGLGVKKNSKTLIIDFEEVIVQPFVHFYCTVFPFLANCIVYVTVEWPSFFNNRISFFERAKIAKSHAKISFTSAFEIHNWIKFNYTFNDSLENGKKQL